MRIVKAHRVQKLLVEDFLDRIHVAGFKGGVQVRQLVRLGAGLVFKPRQHLLHIDLTHLAVRNPQLVSAAGRFLRRRQVARHIEKTPNVADAAPDFIVRQLLVQRLGDRLALNQALDFHLRRAVRAFADQLAHHCVSAGVQPVRLRLCLRVDAKRVDIIDYVPRAVYVLPAETIAVIPFSRFLMMRFQPVVRKHFTDLFVREAEVFIKTRIGNRMHHQIVESREDALL